MCDDISSVAFAVWLASDLTSERRRRIPTACRAGGLDGGVERQEIGLFGDRGNQFHHIADLLRRAPTVADPAVGLLGLDHAALRDLLIRARAGDFIDPDIDISSVAAATDCILLEASSDAPATRPTGPAWFPPYGSVFPRRIRAAPRRPTRWRR